MRPPTPPAPSALSPAATDTVAVPGLQAPEMQGDDPEPWTQSRFRLRLPFPPEPQPRPRRRRRRLPFRPPSSHGPAARRQPSHVIQPRPRPRPTARGDALLGDAGAGRIPSLGLRVLLLGGLPNSRPGNRQEATGLSPTCLSPSKRLLRVTKSPSLTYT